MFAIALLFAILSLGLGILAFGVAPTSLRSIVDAAFLASVACFLLSMTGGLAQRLHRSFQSDLNDLDARSQHDRAADH